MKLRKKRNQNNKTLKKELNNHLDKGGSLKDSKAKIILSKINPVQKNDGNAYSKKITSIKDTPIKTGSGNIPTLLDFGITYKEARFVTEFIKEYDEKKAALNAKITNKHMSKLEEERVINELLSNPNVSIALQCSIQDQVHRTLVTSDRTITQIAKMAFADPLELYEDDGSGRIKDIKDIPSALRCCISEMTHKSVYNGRGDERTVTGHLTKIKLHDSLKALTILLKDIRDKSDKMKSNINFTQFNNFGPSGTNMKERLKELSNEELDILIKLSNQGVEGTMRSKALPQKTDNGELNEELNIEDSADDIIELARAKNLEDGTQLYALNDLKDIEQQNL